MPLSMLPLTILWLAALIGQGALIKLDPSPLLQSDSESRQNNYNFQQQQYNPQIIPSPSRFPQPQYPQNYPYRPDYHRYPPQPIRYPQPGAQQFFGGAPSSQQQSFMDILETVAANDELHCVSKILCEMSAGRRSPSQPQQSFVNLESLLSLLSSVDDTSASPLVKFGKAFIVGYSSKHISQCHYAYPKCPSDPDRLIHYLNNQNGGLFRFFNGNNRRIQNYNPRDLFQNIYNMYNPSQEQVTQFLNNNQPFTQSLNNQPLSQSNVDNFYSPLHEEILNSLHNQYQYKTENNIEQSHEGFRIRRGKSLKFPPEKTDTKEPYFPFYFPGDSSNNVKLDTDNTIVFKYTK